jgi:DNA-binding NarL/FixJ family response regulator
VQRIKVLIVDDHPVVRLGLKAALDMEEDMEVVSEQEDAEGALREARASSPDVVLMDVRMPGVGGIEGCRIIRAELPNTKVIMLTSSSDEEAVMASIMAGAAGYLLKNTGRSELLDAIRGVASGKSLLDPGVTTRVLSRLKDLTAREEAREASILSNREKEVLVLVAAGQTHHLREYRAQPREPHNGQDRGYPPQRGRDLRRPARPAGQAEAAEVGTRQVHAHRVEERRRGPARWSGQIRSPVTISSPSPFPTSSAGKSGSTTTRPNTTRSIPAVLPLK